MRTPKPTSQDPDGYKADLDCDDWEPYGAMHNNEMAAAAATFSLRQNHPLFEFRLVGPRYIIERRRKS